MESFPNEILMLVFAFISRKGADRLSVLLTCKLWNLVGLDVFDPSEDENLALRLAAEIGSTECVRSLLRDVR